MTFLFSAIESIEYITTCIIPSDVSDDVMLLSESVGIFFENNEETINVLKDTFDVDE